MTDLKLEVGEGILLQTTDAGLYNGNDEISIDELYLTNRYLICVYEKSTGFFKSETVVDKIPLSSIAVINGIVQIQQVDDDVADQHPQYTDREPVMQYVAHNHRRCGEHQRGHDHKAGFDNAPPCDVQIQQKHRQMHIQKQ